MDTGTALEVLRKSLVQFVIFNNEEWAKFTQHLSFSKLKKKQHFIQADAVCDKISFIVSGSVRYYHMISGNDITNYFCFEEEFISSYKSFLTKTPSITYIKALEETLLINISYNALQ